ncbi:MAG: TlpA family protein disulfide reductase [Planctomycetaceae bacterium]|jgi:thiol-disulfide isomerase/thioredoxin|nr:TlpA family protein disulfide reductase [Planctomycetaceae bacterium]
MRRTSLVLLALLIAGYSFTVAVGDDVKKDGEANPAAPRTTAAKTVASVPPIIAEYRKFRSEKFLPLQKDFSVEKFNEAVAGAKEFAARKDYPQPFQPLLYAVNFASQPAAVKADPKLTEKTIKDFIEFVNSDKFDHPEAVKKAAVAALERTAAQIKNVAKRSLGADLKLYGKNIDGSDFDWSSLRGKYVVVKFTATWCGPCRGEIPGLISAYEKYHDKGLEIVSVYVWERSKNKDDDNDLINDNIKEFAAKEKINWRIISEPLTLKAGGEKIGEFYGVQGVPTMLLIDKEGKIIDTAARGQHLQDKLAEIFDGKTTAAQ